jgi:hypothetical protein
MLYVVLANGSLEELPDATQVVARDGTVSCVDSEGRLVKHYERGEVAMYSRDDKAKQVVEMMRDESSRGEVQRT